MYRIITQNNKILEPIDLRRDYHLMLGKLELAHDAPHLLYSLDLPDPNDLVNLYCQYGYLEKAVLVAQLFDIEISAVCITLADQCLVLPSITQGRVLTAEFAHCPLKSRYWLALHALLSRNDSVQKGYPLHTIVIQEILQRQPNFCLPEWLTRPLQSSFPASLLRLYLMHDRTADALELAVQVLEVSFLM